MDINNLVRDCIKKLKPYSSARDEYKSLNDDMIFIDANENPFQTKVNRYPDPNQTSVKAILSKLKLVPEQNILLGNGSDEVLDLIFRAFCEPGLDNIITLPPTYGMYNVLADINNIQVREVLLSETFQPKVDEILAAADSNSKILFLCSPNNPTGNSFKDDEMTTLLSSFSGIIVIDEAYIDFSTTSSWTTRLEDFPNVIVTQTLSKAYGLAGIRLGICYASEEIITILKKIKPPYNVNTLTQSAAIDRLKNEAMVKEEIKNIINERNKLQDCLSQIPFVEKVYPSDANFLLVKVDDANKRYDELVKRGVVVRNRSSQPLCENCLRFTIGTTEENEKLINILQNLER